MDQQHRGFSLLAYLVVIQLVLGCLVGSGATEPDESSADVIRLIHPTMHRAFLLDDGNTLLETNTLALIRSSNTSYRRLVKYPGAYSPDVATAAKISSSSTNYYPSKRKPNYTARESEELRQKSIAVVRMTYDNEIDTYKKSYANLTNVDFGRRTSCHKQAFRAFDLVRIPRVKSISDSAVAVGFSDTHICLFYYDSFDPTRVRDDPFGTATNISEKVLPTLAGSAFNLGYRVASATLLHRDSPGPSPTIEVVVEYYDEAGQIISFVIDSPDSSAPSVRNIFSTGSLSSVNMIPGDDRNIDYEDEATKKELNELRTGVMRQHFQHAFVESIALLEGTLTYSRGIFHEPRFSVINETEPSWTKALLLTQNTRLTLAALEMYKHNETYYIHAYNLVISTSLQYIYPRVSYSWCSVRAPEREQLVSMANSSQNCKIDEYKPKWAPIDVVYRAQCNKVYAFYQHLVQSESATQAISSNSSYTVLDWMRFPVNAILHYKDRLYLFGPANNLRISAPIGDDCTFEQVSVPDEDFYQSDLLFMFSEAAGGAKHPGSPFYDSERYFDGRSWTPSLDNQKEIPTGLLLHTPVESDNFSFMLIVLLLVVIILVLLAVAYLYFVRTENQPQGKRSEVEPRSSMRRKKSVRSPKAVAKSSDRKPKPSPPTILDSPTIRSGHNLPVENPPTLKTSNDPTVVEPQQPLGPLKSRQTSGGVGKSPSNLAKAPSSATKSPSGADGSSSRLGKSPSGPGPSRGEASTSAQAKSTVAASWLGRSVGGAGGSQAGNMGKTPKTPRSPTSPKNPDSQTKVKKA